MLHLVPPSPQPNNEQLQGNKNLTAASFNLEKKSDNFFCRIKEVRPYTFSFMAQDKMGILRCTFLLDIQQLVLPAEVQSSEEPCPVTVVICDFPDVACERLYDYIRGDEYLMGHLACMFYINVLEQLMLFSEHQTAFGLLFLVNENMMDELETYRQFIDFEVKIIKTKRRVHQVLVNTGVKAYDHLIDFRENAEEEFQKTLWRHQMSNPTYRQHLKDICLVK